MVIWKNITDTNNKYKISNNGDVYSYYSKKNMKINRSKK